MPSPTLTAIFAYTKAGAPSFAWRDVRTVLAPIFHEDMSLRDVLQVVVKAYEEALLEDRYEMPSRSQAGLNLLLAPMNRYVPPFTRSWPELDTSITFEQMYDAFLAHMLSELMLARVDWLKEDSSPAKPSRAAIEHSATS